MTPPRVRSLERMEGRRPGVRGGAGRRPISPRAPERRGRCPPGALGSPAAFPSDMLPGREEETNNEVNRGDEYADPGRSPTPLAGCPSVSGVPPAAIQLLPHHVATPGTTRARYGAPSPQGPAVHEAVTHPSAPELQLHTARAPTLAPARLAAGPESQHQAEVCVAGPGRRHLSARRK